MKKTHNKKNYNSPFCENSAEKEKFKVEERTERKKN